MGAPSADQPARAPQRGPSEFHIPSLDGIRAVSFLIVFVSHAGLTIVPGGFGVTVFFFLSGYLITSLLRLEYQGSGRISLRDFYLRRVLRIFPPFYLVLGLAAVAVVAGLVPGRLEARPMLALVGHYANYWAIAFGTDGQPPGTGVYWSLAVEEHFYLVFPLAFIAMQRALPGNYRAHGALLLAACGVMLAWRAYLVLELGVSQPRTFLATDTRADSILFGCALAVAANPMLDSPRVPVERLLRLWLPSGLALLVACLVIRAEWFRETLRYTLQGIGLAPVFVAAMRAPEWGPFRLLNHPLARRLGVLSYSLYLVHQVVLYALEGPLPDAPLLRGACALAVSIAIAEVLQRTVEKPCARLRRRLAHATWLSAWRPPEPSTAAAPAAEPALR